MKLLPIIAGLLLLFYQPVSAQKIKALLVQLNTEQSKIATFKRVGKIADAQKVAKACTGMNKKMIRDFTDNFAFCPVYYYVDTNLDLIKKKQFANILLDEHGLPVADPVISALDTNYLVALYGFDDGTVNVVSTKGLVVYTDKFKQKFFFRRYMVNEAGKKYVYICNEYNIDYCPVAKNLELRMHRHYDE